MMRVAVRPEMLRWGCEGAGYDTRLSARADGRVSTKVGV